MLGIGIGVPGFIDMAAGMVMESPNLPDWKSFPVRDEIERRLGTKVILENDANSAAMGEKWLGAGRQFDHMAMYTLGTGVGGGLVFNGRLWHGMTGMAGELGHFNVYADGHPCGCGSRGCLEQYASATAVVRMAREAIARGESHELESLSHDEGQFTSRSIYNLAVQGETAARKDLRKRRARTRNCGWLYGERPQSAHLCHRRRSVERMGYVCPRDVRRDEIPLFHLFVDLA